MAGLFGLALALSTTRGLESADAAVHLDLALALVSRGETTLSIDPGELWVPSRPLAGGLFYASEEGLRSASSPGLALLALPFVAVANVAAGPPPNFDALFAGGPPESVLRPLQGDGRVFAFVLVGPLSAALALTFFVLAARELGASARATQLGAAALALGSPFLAYAGSAWTQLPTMAALTFLLWRLAAREVRPSGNVWPMGVAGALAILVRPDHLPFLLLAGVTLHRIERSWRRSPSPALARFVTPIALACAVLAFFGLPESGDGYSLARLPLGALGLLTSPHAGLVAFAPFVLLAPFARLPARIAMLVSGWLACALLLYGGWFDWEASLAYGPRFLLPILPALALALVTALDSLRRRLAAGLAIALGFAVNLPGALLVHARIAEPASPLEGWRELLTRGSVDCVSVLLPIHPALVFLVAVLGLWLASRAPVPR